MPSAMPSCGGLTRLFLINYGNVTRKKCMDILGISYLRGPNVWSCRPVMEATIDIGVLEHSPSNTITGFSRRLTALLPTLVEHSCSVGTRGGFLERLRDGTYAGHILEHVVLELQSLAGMPTVFGQTRQVAGESAIYKMVFRTYQEEVGRAALAAGRDLLMAVIEDRPYALDDTLASLQALVERLCLGPGTAHIVDAANRRGIPAIRLADDNLVQLGYGACQRRIWTAETESTSALAEGISGDKDLTKTLLAACGVPVPEGELVRSIEAALEAADDIGLPVVVKPYNGNHGRGVFLNLTRREDIVDAYRLASREADGDGVIVESFIQGKEHRLLVVAGRLVAAARGETVWVTGDGGASIIELVDQQINIDPRRGAGEHAPLARLVPGRSSEIMLELERQGLRAWSVPAAGQKVLIQPNGNVADDVTDKVHPDTAAIAVLAARVIGLDIAGIDLVVEDIARPLDQQGGAIVEINASPGLLAHTKPGSGAPRAVGKAIVNHMFGDDAGVHDGRIPIVGITGSRGTALIARLLAGLMQLDGRRVGLSCQGSQSIDGRPLSRDTLPEWDAAQRLLINRTVDAAVFECSARTILTAGLPYDKCLIGVVTDVTGTNDLAALHVHDRKGLARVLRTQVDVVLPDGVAVLNAADDHVAAMASLCDGAVIFYGLDASLAPIVAHRALGQRAAFLCDGNIVLTVGMDIAASLPLALLPPAIVAQPEAALAATAAAWAWGLEPKTIQANMRSLA